MTHENDTPDSTPMVPRNGKTSVRKTQGMPPPQLGDYAQFGEKNQLYWNTIPPQFRMPPAKPVVVSPFSTTSTKTQDGFQVQSKFGMRKVDPTAVPQDFPQEFKDAAKNGTPIPFQNVSPGELLRQDVFIGEAKARLGAQSDTTFAVQQPEQQVPPITARMVDDSSTAAGMDIPAGAPGGPFRLGLTITVPNRWIMIINRLACSLENAGAFVEVEWQLAINGRPVGPTCGQVLSPLDPFAPATPGTWRNDLFPFPRGEALAAPVIVNQTSTITFSARSLNPAPAGRHIGQFRMMGYMYPVQTTSSDGTYQEFHSA